jgi:hypothetical protein
MWSRGGLWVLLMMLNCMSFENPWKTCEGQSPMDVVDGELATDTPGYQKNIFGHIKVIPPNFGYGILKFSLL